MASKNLEDVYRQYQYDIDAVATWLASTAKGRGFPAEKLTSKTWALPRFKNHGGRLKGKERKEAIDAAKAVPFLVPLGDYLPLATFIAQCENPTVSVPDSFSKTIERVIYMRTYFGNVVIELGAKHNAQSGKNHGRYLGILEDVRDVLGPRMSPPYEPPPNGNGPEADRKDISQVLEGMFLSVPFEDPISKEFLQAFQDPPERPEAQKNDTVNYEAEPTGSYEDIMFVFQLLVHDLDLLRKKVSYIWAMGRDVAATAVATNTAIALARNLIEDFTPMLNNHSGGIHDVLGTYYHMKCALAGYNVNEVVESGPDMLNGELFVIADQTYFSTYNIVCTFSRSVTNQGVTLYAGIAPEYDPTSDRASKTGLEKFDEDSFLLRECCTELLTLIRALPDYPIEDELLQCMKDYEKNQKLTMTLVFASQIYLDIINTMRDGTRIAFEKANNEAQLIQTHCEEYLKYHNRILAPKSPIPNIDTLDSIKTWVALTRQDPVHQVQLNAYAQNKLHVPAYLTPNRMLTHSPTMTGLWLFHIRTAMHKFGMLVANRWGAVAACAHLYHAVCEEGLLNNPWIDMEIATRILGDSTLWMGGRRPLDLQDAFQKWCIQRGVPATMITKKRRNNISANQRLAPRPVKHDAPVTYTFAESFGSLGTYAAWTPEGVADVLSQLKYRNVITDGGASRVVKVDMSEPPKVAGRKKFAGLTIVPDNPSPVFFTPPAKLVEGVMETLDAEGREVAFPFSILHRHCWTMLRNIKKRLEPILRPIYGQAIVDMDATLPELATYCLVDASGARTGTPDMRLLQGVALTMEKMIASGRGCLSYEYTRSIGMMVRVGVRNVDDENDDLNENVREEENETNETKRNETKKNIVNKNQSEIKKHDTFKGKTG